MSPSPYSGKIIKQKAIIFLIGKITSALLTFFILFWLVRLLAIKEYGIYIALNALINLAFSILSFGLPWLASRYLPDFLLHANGRQIKEFVWQLTVKIGFFYLLGGGVLFVAMPWLLTTQGLGQQKELVSFYFLVLMLERIRMDFQQSILEPLLQQGAAQLSQLFRNIGFLLCLLFEVSQTTVDLYNVFWAELAGTILGFLPVFYGLTTFLRINLNSLAKNDWQPPSWSVMWPVARNMYYSQLVDMTYSSSVFIILIQRLIGLEASALFGFLLNLFGQVNRFLPTTLLFSIIRPKLMASYINEGGITQLSRNANLVGKVNLFILMPILMITWVAGGELLNLFSGGKFTQEPYTLAAIFLVLIPVSQRLIIETVAVVSGQSNLCYWGSLMGSLGLPIAYWSVISGQGILGCIFAMCLGHILCNLTIITFMAITNSYRPDVVGFLKLVLAAIVGFLLSILTFIICKILFVPDMSESVSLLDNIDITINQFLPLSKMNPIDGWISMVPITVLMFVFFLLASFIFKPFREEERMRLSRIIRYKLR